MAAPSRVEEEKGPVTEPPRNPLAVARDITDWRAGIALKTAEFMARQRVPGSTLGNPHITPMRARIKLDDFVSEVFGTPVKHVTEVPHGLRRFLEPGSALTSLPVDKHNLGRFLDGTFEVKVSMPHGLRSIGFVAPQLGGTYMGHFFQRMPDGSYINMGGAPNLSLPELADAATRLRKIY